LSAKVAPVGREPDVSAGVGYPLVLTVKANAVPAVSVTVAALENVGDWSTVKVNAWLALPVEFLAVNVIG
jgi:hypothetical protein